jgi:MinD superfamily P-loop ATPase
MTEFRAARRSLPHPHLWIAVASGKGGTGKTSVAVSLATAAAAAGRRVQLIDADVEGPNVHHFLQLGTPEEIPVSVMLPEIDKDRCTQCGVCVESCTFHALAQVYGGILVFPELCHACEACLELCPIKAISAGCKEIGIIRHWRLDNLDIWQGHLHIGQVQTPALIRALFHHADPWEGNLTIVDAPPGTACPMVAAIRQSDLLLLVTEPTPFGRHDLDLALAVARQMQIPAEVVINRSTGNDECIETLCRSRGIEIPERFPYDRLIAEAYAAGKAMGEVAGPWNAGFQRLARRWENLP